MSILIVQFAGITFGINPVKKDSIEIGIMVMQLILMAGNSVAFPVCVLSCQNDILMFRGLKSNCLYLNVILTISTYYTVASGLFLFAVFAYYAIIYLYGISRWLECIRLI